MQVDGHVEFLDGREQLVELGGIQESALRVPVDDDPAESQLVDRPFGFDDRGTRVLGGKSGQRVEPVGMGRDGLRAPVVDRPTEPLRMFGRHLLGSRCCHRKNLHVDARLVHDPQSLFADVGKIRGERFRRVPTRPHLVDKVGGKQVFFKGDECHGISCSSCSSCCGLHHAER